MRISKWPLLPPVLEAPLAWAATMAAGPGRACTCPRHALPPPLVARPLQVGAPCGDLPAVPAWLLPGCLPDGLLQLPVSAAWPVSTHHCARQPARSLHESTHPALPGAAASPLLLAASAATSAQTMRIRAINHEAARNDSVGERVAHWKAYFREKGGWVAISVWGWECNGSVGERGCIGGCGCGRSVQGGVQVAATEEGATIGAWCWVLGRQCRGVTVHSLCPTPTHSPPHPVFHSPRLAGEELRAAVEEWQLKRGSAGDGAQRLTTAFLDGTHPVVDVYELKVRVWVGG